MFGAGPNLPFTIPLTETGECIVETLEGYDEENCVMYLGASSSHFLLSLSVERVSRWLFLFQRLSSLLSVLQRLALCLITRLSPGFLHQPLLGHLGQLVRLARRERVRGSRRGPPALSDGFSWSCCGKQGLQGSDCVKKEHLACVEGNTEPWEKKYGKKSGERERRIAEGYANCYLARHVLVCCAPERGGGERQ